MIAALEIRRNEGGKKILSDKVFGSTIRKLRQPNFLEQVRSTMRDEVLMTEQGPMHVKKFSVPATEFFDCVIDITKGLLTTFYPQFDYHAQHFKALDFHSATLAKGSASQQLNVLHALSTQTQPEVRGNFNEFLFRRYIDEQRKDGIWLLMFYEAVAFVICHGDVSLDDRFGNAPHPCAPKSDGGGFAAS